MEPRGVLYVIWGNGCDDELERSRRSVERFGLPVEVKRLDAKSGLNDKSSMFEWSPFENTLFLDTDTEALSDLSFGFEMSARHGLAITIAPFFCAKRWGTDDVVEYNTGVIFFDRRPAVRDLFARWAEIAHRYDNDQGGFAQAVYDRSFNPFVLPPTWNFRADYHGGRFLCGPMKVWHSRFPVPEKARTASPDGRFWHLTGVSDAQVNPRGIFDAERSSVLSRLFGLGRNAR